MRPLAFRVLWLLPGWPASSSLGTDNHTGTCKLFLLKVGHKYTGIPLRIPMCKYQALLIISNIPFTLGWPVGIKDLDIKSLLKPLIWIALKNEVLPENIKVT